MVDRPSADVNGSRRVLERGLADLLATTRGDHDPHEMEDTAKMLSHLLATVRPAGPRVDTQIAAAAILGAVRSVSEGWWDENPELNVTEVAAELASALWGGLNADFGR